MELTKNQYHRFLNIQNEMEKVVEGKQHAIQMLLVTLLAGGHMLIEDVPGVGKTTLALTLGKASGLLTKRAQFTPDVMASDITGFTMFNKETGDFEYRPGLVMCNILLADEINRTSPKTQSALLEAMEERTVSVDSTTYSLMNPFMVIATQNELGYVGTYPLPEAQLDRFLIRISMGYPSKEQELSILKNRINREPIKEIREVCSKSDIIACIKASKDVIVEQEICKYIINIVTSTRNHPHIRLGASPRASVAMMRAAQAYAFLQGRSYVRPEDIQVLTPHVLSHRLQIKQDVLSGQRTPESVLADILRSLKVPHRRETAQ